MLERPVAVAERHSLSVTLDDARLYGSLQCIKTLSHSTIERRCFLTLNFVVWSLRAHPERLR